MKAMAHACHGSPDLFDGDRSGGGGGGGVFRGGAARDAGGAGAAGSELGGAPASVGGPAAPRGTPDGLHILFARVQELEAQDSEEAPWKLTPSERLELNFLREYFERRAKRPAQK